MPSTIVIMNSFLPLQQTCSVSGTTGNKVSIEITETPIEDGASPIEQSTRLIQSSEVEPASTESSITGSTVGTTVTSCTTPSLAIEIANTRPKDLEQSTETTYIAPLAIETVTIDHKHLEPPMETATAPYIVETVPLIPKQIQITAAAPRLAGAAKLKKMIEETGDLIVCPGVYDGVSARVALQVGFDAMYMVPFPFF